MKNLNVRKKLMMLAMANTFVLSGIVDNTSYASENTTETVNATDFENIKDIVVAKDEDVAIKDKPGRGYSLLGFFKPGEYLKLISDCEKDYEVLYKGQICYVNKEYVYESTLDDYTYEVDSKDIIVAEKLTEIKEDNNANSNTIGTLKEKESLKVNGEKDGYFEVIYKDNLAYVDMNDVTYKQIFEKSGYALKNSNIYSSSTLDNSIADINELEFVKIYNEENDTYYVEANGIMGYMSKSDIQLLSDKYIVVDISDQIVEMYDNNELLLSSSVVTGKPPKNSTPTGVYYIGDGKNEITDHRYLVGPNYKSYVDYMMKFTGNIGFHDSERGIDDRGTSHGWRNYEDYGGDTYLSNGSHGCVNMPNEAAETMYNIVYPYVVEKGNLVKVLVKE